MLNTPVLLLVFNRLETSKVVFASIREAKPARLFIAADGARENKEGEKEICEEIKQYLLKNIDWNCEVTTLFRDQNLGCAKAVSGAITWFFEHVEQGIILEDDCLPRASFFSYCEELLNLYKNDPEVWEIGGNNFQDGIQRGDGSYYFSHYGSIWGWATWRRAWKYYDLYLKEYDKFVHENKMAKITGDPFQQQYWKNAFANVKEKLHTWDYQWVFAVMNHGGLCIVPNVTLIENIGFSKGATHTFEQPSWYRQHLLGIGEIKEMKHPSGKILFEEADNYMFYKAHAQRPTLISRIKGFVNRRFFNKKY